MPLRRNRRQYEQLTDFDRGRIIGLREAGWSNRRIGRHLGRSDMVVARCWQQWITEGRVYRRGGSGRPRNTNDREDRAIRRVATSAPTTSLASIQRHLPPSRHPVPSRETIRRRLTEVGLRSRRPLRRLPLTPHHRQCRLDFCRPRATWSVTDWRRVIFSDESRFSLSADDHRTRVWRRTGQRSDPAFIVERHTAISQGVTVWGAISWDTRSSLVVLQGTLTARRYVDDILTPIVLPMLSSRPGAIYQQDNARPHTARLSQQCLQGYDVLPWPARTPDLSPIEHVRTRWERHTPGHALHTTAAGKCPSSPEDEQEKQGQFFFDKGKMQVRWLKLHMVFGADTVTANYVQFWFRRFRSGIFDVEDAPRTCRPLVENVDKITEIIEVDRYVRSIAQELKIGHRTV
ncbi:transposable element Tcb2 transposase [Trichonephila clavipes]|nr:transposable element Tcb2 transposase [Trichonephila clavipes]